MKVSLNHHQRTILFSIMDYSNRSVSEVLAQAFGLLEQQEEQHRLQGEQRNENNKGEQALS